MAKRLYFKISNHYHSIYEMTADFKFHPGFALVQKQKSIQSLHSSIISRYPNSNVLEVSSKSTVVLGVNLSAFNLKIYDAENQIAIPIENVFQSSKVFVNGGPYRDLLHVSPKEAKTEPRLKESGLLRKFNYLGTDWPLEPKSLFYDWIYINALSKTLGLIEAASNYDIFTDIEFNHTKSINCQARSVALCVCLYKTNSLTDALSSPEKFLNYHKRCICSSETL